MQSIFISSTFQDMQYERDAIHRNVLPMLREHIRSYGQSVDFSDLRWGINSKDLSEEESAVKIIQVCFNEIDKSRPYMIVLLGDRYGWIPDVDKIQPLLELQGVCLPRISGKSITEMEIDHGCMTRQDQETEILFYFRKISNLAQMKRCAPGTYASYVSGNLMDRHRIRLLKSEIRRRFPDRVREYTLSWDSDSGAFSGMDDFCEMVFEDLKGCMEKHLGQMQQMSWQQKEALNHWFNFETDAFELTEDQLDTGFQTDAVRSLIQGTLPEHIQSLWLSGEDRYKLDRYVSSIALLAREKGQQVIAYDCGSTLFSSDLRNMIRYLLWHISGEEAADETLTLSRLGEQLCNSMERYQKTPLVIVIRNVDALTRNDLSLWYPRKACPLLRFLISGVPCTTGAGFKSRNVDVYFNMDGGFPEQEYIQLQMKKHHKQIDRQVMVTLLKKAEGKSARYMNALLDRLATFTKADFDHIQHSGGDMNAISEYLQRVAQEQPEALALMMRSTIQVLKTEISPDFVDSVLALLSVLPDSITAEHLERILGNAGQTWNSLDFVYLRQHLQSLFTVSLDGSMKIADRLLSEELRNIYLTERSAWLTRLNWYMQTIPFGDDLYKKQYLLLAADRNDPIGLWKYLHRAGDDDEYALLMLHRILRGANGTCWMKAVFETLPHWAKKLEQSECADPGDGNASITRGEFDKLVFWCTNRLYPWLREEALLSKDWLPMWRALAEAAAMRYASEPNHITNNRSFDTCFQLGETAFLFGEPQEAKDVLLRALELAREDMERWPNVTRKQLMGIPLTKEDYQLALQKAPEGTSPEIALMLAYGTEAQDAAAGISYSSFTRIIHQYLGAMYEKAGDEQNAKRHFEEADTYTSMLDPNPENRAEAEVCDGIKIIMPWALDGKSAEKPSKIRYKPDYRRNTAIRKSKEATVLLKQGQYEAAIELFMKSSEILRRIHEDGTTDEVYDLDGVVGDPDVIRLRISSECLRDLGLNYSSLMKAYYQTGQLEDCRKMLREGLDCCLQFDEVRNSRESKLDLQEYYFTAMHYHHYLGEEAEEYDMACRLQNACLEAIRAGSKYDDTAKQHMGLACTVILNGIKAQPERGEPYMAMLLDRCNNAMRARDLNNYVLLVSLARELLPWYLEKGVVWTVQGKDGQEVMTMLIKNACDVLKDFREWEAFRNYADLLSTLSDKITLADARFSCRCIFTDLGMNHFGNGEYAQAAQWFVKALEIMEPVTPQWYMPINLLQDMVRIVPAYSEAGEQQIAAEYGERSLQYAQVVMKLGCGNLEQEHNISRKEWEEAWICCMAELNLNLGINAGRMGKPNQMEAYFHQSQSYAERLGDEKASFKRNILNRVRAFRNPENGILTGTAKQQENMIRESLGRLDDLFDRVFSGRCGPAEAGHIADEAEQILCRLGTVPNFAILVSPDQLLRYYYFCGNLHSKLGRRETSAKMFRKAIEYGENCEMKELLARAYTDLCAMTENKSEQINTIRKAISLQEDLMKAHQLRDPNDLAMSYYNCAVLGLQLKQYATAASYAEKARSLWESLTASGRRDCMEYLKEATRLSNVFKD